MRNNQTHNARQAQIAEQVNIRLTISAGELKVRNSASPQRNICLFLLEAIMIDNLVKLKDFVPFFQTVITSVLVLLLLLLFRKALTQLINIIGTRIQDGSSFEAGPLKVGEALTELKHIEQDDNSVQNETNETEREQERLQIYRDSCNLFLAHILVPSDRKGYRYDIYIYLIRHKSKDFSDIDSADFFFGRMWGNKVFKAKNEKGLIGISTSAYSPFLCTCHIKMTDGKTLKIHKYIDFEMKRIANPSITNHVI